MRAVLGVVVILSWVVVGVHAQPPAAFPIASSEGFSLGQTRTQALRACTAASGEAEDDTRTAITCSLAREDEDATEHYLVASLCGARVCRIDVFHTNDGANGVTVLGPRARTITERITAASIGTPEDGGNDPACATSVLGGDDTCLSAMRAGQTIFRRSTVTGGGYARVRFVRHTGAGGDVQETYMDARGDSLHRLGPDDQD